MPIPPLLMPAITARLFARSRVLKRRAAAERKRQAAGLAHEVHYFHQVDDPYSALAAASLPQLVARYDIALIPHVVGSQPDAAAPERARMVAYSRRDAQMLAQHYGLDYTDPGIQPLGLAVDAATRVLVAAVANGQFLDVAAPVSEQLWQRPTLAGSFYVKEQALPEASPEAAQAHVQAANALRAQWGHYQGATFFYAGEWYGGIDRLYHLEQRLQALCARRRGAVEHMFSPSQDLRAPVELAHTPVIDFFFSLRSPYSAIVAQRVFALGRLTGAPVRLRFVLPMVMRGLPVPKAKRDYIVHDAAREAHVRGIPFGRLNDPVGKPTERGLALIPLAERQGKGEAYLLSFLQGVWAEGLDAGSDRGLRRIAERAGLAWNHVQFALNDEGWRATAAANRDALLALGLWGVPSFHVDGLAVWGQDRLWAVQEAVLAYHRPGNNAEWKEPDGPST